jgi:hypothetical protein
MGRACVDETCPIDVMRERILPTVFTAALFLSVAVFEVGPLAAPKAGSTPAMEKNSAAKPEEKNTPKIVVPGGAEAGSTPARKLAMYEPERGAYLGAALDYSKLTGNDSKMGAMADTMGRWEAQSWRENAIYVQFTPFPHDDGKFPTWDSDPKGWTAIGDFCNAAVALNAAPLLTLEPMLPRVFVDGWKPGSEAYEATRALAIKMGELEKPAFIRFAHEMNGSWYPWAEWMDKNKNLRRDPGEDTGFPAADYCIAYRNMAAIFRQYAPNVALVWCPNSGLLGGERRDVFTPFYPGDDVVDWVGIDIYERGWNMPMPGEKLWGGQLAYNLTRDEADDRSTPDTNESVNFYETFAVKKGKPLMLAETGATLSYRTDLPLAQRALMNHAWKAGRWSGAEYGWLQAVYGTSTFFDHKLLQPIDKSFPMLKAIVWFQIAKRESVPVEKILPGNQRRIIWFDDGWTDYRIGGGAEEGAPPPPYADEELTLFRRLTKNKYFLSNIVK